MLDHIFLFVLYTILHWVHSEFLQYMYMKKGSIHTVTAGVSYQEYHVPLVMLKKSHKQSRQTHQASSFADNPKTLHQQDVAMTINRLI